jgi:hypothetical protein
MRQTEALIVAMDTRISAFKGEGVDTDRLEKGLFALRNRFHSLFHNVDTEKVRRDSTQIIGELKRLDRVLDGIGEERRKRKVAGAMVVAGFILAAVLLHQLKKTYDR